MMRAIPIGAILLATLATLATLVATGATAEPEPAAETSCTICHGDADEFDEEFLEILTRFHGDIHASVGLSCHDCHGGNPDPALADDMDAAMDPDFAARPYVGAPARGDVPGFCGSCHSDPVFMRRYGPDPRVDQEQEYWTSHHGKALAQGDGRVATCIDCHGVHGILAVDDAESPVYPLHVSSTCGSCHSDPEHMKGTVLDNGRPISVDQEAKWSRSVHARALFEMGDLTAPTCNDCHGNHGAAPPGVESVAYVCGSCHGREADLFRGSVKFDKLAEHNEYLLESEGESCAGCHSEPEPAASVELLHFADCTTCHGNHGVVRPTIAMLGVLPETPCALCHESVSDSLIVLDEPGIRLNYEETLARLLADAGDAGLAGNDRFDWLVDRALELPAHGFQAPGEEGDAFRLRPEFTRLFSKFRIGKTHYTYPDPVTGEERMQPVITCTRCHAEEPDLADEPLGLETARAYLAGMRELMATTAVAERTLLIAERGGVLVEPALGDLDQAVDAQIGLEVLVHTFDPGGDERFLEEHATGMEHALNALDYGREALRELSNRRRGLLMALGFIALTAVALLARIRGLPS